MMLLGAALTALLVGQAPALAEDPAYVAGQQLFEEFEFEKAVFRFEDALNVEGRSDRDKATVLVRLGMTWAELRREDKALDAFVRAVQLDPLAALPPDASPKIKEMLDEARRKARDARPTVVEQPPDEELAPMVLETPAAEPTPQADLAPPDEGLPWILLTGGAIVAVGVLGSALGGVVWGSGLALRELGNGQEFQSDALAYDLPARAGQFVGQAVLAAGLVALVAGGGVTLVSIVVE